MQCLQPITRSICKYSLAGCKYLTVKLTLSFVPCVEAQLCSPVFCTTTFAILINVHVNDPDFANPRNPPH